MLPPFVLPELRFQSIRSVCTIHKALTASGGSPPPLCFHYICPVVNLSCFSGSANKPFTFSQSFLNQQHYDWTDPLKNVLPQTLQVTYGGAAWWWRTLAFSCSGYCFLLKQTNACAGPTDNITVGAAGDQCRSYLWYTLGTLAPGSPKYTSAEHFPKLALRRASQQDKHVWVTTVSCGEDLLRSYWFLTIAHVILVILSIPSQ